MWGTPLRGWAVHEPEYGATEVGASTEELGLLKAQGAGQGFVEIRLTMFSEGLE